ncbi:hypothetical protein Tco_0549505 [Tanacetum coccineum]
MTQALGPTTADQIDKNIDGKEPTEENGGGGIADKKTNNMLKPGPDVEASNHEDASDSLKEEYDIWAMEMEHYLEYIDNDVWKKFQVLKKERKAKNILLMAIPKEHMRRFHGMDDAKEIWEAIRTRKSKLPTSTCNIHSTSSTNTPEKEALAGFANEVIYSLFAKQSEDWDLLHEDLEQIDDLDIEEMDINWHIAMIAIRMKSFYEKGRRVRVDGKAPQKGYMMERRRADSLFINTKKLWSYGNQEKNQMGLLTIDDGIVNWGEHTEDEETNHALMAISSSSVMNK